MTIETLERDRTKAIERRSKLRAPMDELATVEATIADLDEQIAAEQAAQEAERLAVQQRENEIASLQREWEQLQRVWEWPAKNKTLERWLWDVCRVSSRLAQLGIEVAPFSIDPLAAVSPLVAAQERAAVVTREMFDRGRATPEQERAAHRRHELTTELMNEGLGQDQVARIAELVADDGVDLDVARRQVLGANEEDHNDGSEAME